MIQLPLEWESYRIKTGPLGSDSTYGANGMFIIPSASGLRRPLDVMVSDGRGPDGANWANWEHASVKVRIGRSTYTPTWDEMSWVKDQLWPATDTVFQFHPSRELYVNFHPNVLHLWRHRFNKIELPPRQLIA